MIRKIVVILWASSLVLAASRAAAEDRSYDALPASIGDFQALQAGESSPELAVSHFILGMLVDEANPELGPVMLKYAMTPDNFVDPEQDPGAAVFLPYMKDHIKRLRADPNIARSYCKGATPANGYQVPTSGCTMVFSRNRLSVVSSVQVRTFVVTSGQGSARPVTSVKGTDGKWRVNEASSLFVGIYLPAQ